MKRLSLWSVAFAFAAASAPLPALAEGAIAVGAPPDVVHQGFAYGIEINAVDDATARQNAYDKCRTAPNSSDMAHNACTVVTGFHQQCAAVSMDPAAGTPGVGWAVAPLRAAAEQQAINNCMATAGADRQSYCVKSASFCDGQ